MSGPEMIKELKSSSYVNMYLNLNRWGGINSVNLPWTCLMHNYQ